MADKREIIYLRFTKHMRPKDIAQKVGVMPSYITKVIKADKRYSKERARQKDKNVKKHNEQTKEIMRKKREEQRQATAHMNLQHNQAVKELSHEVRVTTDNNKRCIIVDPDWIRGKYIHFGCRAE